MEWGNFILANLCFDLRDREFLHYLSPLAEWAADIGVREAEREKKGEEVALEISKELYHRDSIQTGYCAITA